MADESGGPSRRDALRVGAMVATASGLSAVLGAVPRPSRASAVHPPAAYDLAEPASIVSGSCAGCTGGCPIRSVRTGRVIGKVDGNPYAPRQGGDPAPESAAHAARLRGASCARGQARVNVVHDPWRWVRPLLRDGDRGSMRFRTVSAEAWAADVVPDVVAAHHASRGAPPGVPPRVVFAVDPRHNDRRVVLDAAERALAGSKVILGHPAPRLAVASSRAIGEGWLAAPRWERATLRVAWGGDPVSSGLDPVGSARGLAGHRSELVVIDPRLSATGGLAGRWLPVRPGADGELARWIAAIWVRRGLLAEELVPADVRALPDPEAERRTGLGRDLVGTLAERMFAAGPGLAVAIGGGLSDDAATAVLNLCAHAGALGPGGAMAPVSDPIPAVDGPRALAELVLGDTPPNVLIVVGDAGIQDTRHAREVLAAVADPGRVRRVIVVQTAPGPWLAVADAVLPDVTELERLGLSRRHDGSAVAVPVIPPVPSATVDGPLGRGLEGLIDSVCVAIGEAPIAVDAVARALAAAAVGLSDPTPADDAALTGALTAAFAVDPGETGWASAGPVRSLLLRGWIPPAPRDPPLVRPTAFTAASDAPVAGLRLVGWTEPFGGTPDAQAEAWGGRSIRQHNRAVVHPTTAAELGASTGYLRLTAGDASFVVEARVSAEVRPGIVALPRGYGQRTGYAGDLVVDGVALPADPRRCDGVSVGALSTADGVIEAAWAPAPPEPSLLERLLPGPRLVYRPGEAS